MLPKPGHCPAHTTRWDEVKPKLRPSARNYGGDWPKIRKAFIAAHPHCAVCGERADEVDHIDTHGSNEWANLQALCKPHHLSKTRRDAARQSRPR